jgi:GNAT superfamily N-acetyltransferase
LFTESPKPIDDFEVVSINGAEPNQNTPYLFNYSEEWENNTIKVKLKDKIKGFWFAVDSIARVRKYLAFFEGPPINTTKDFVIQNINGNWPHVVAINNGKIIGWCDISALDRPVFAHIGSLGIGVLAPYRGQGVGKALMNATLQKAKICYSAR